MINIEKDKPVPVNGTTIGLTLAKLKLGESFFLPEPDILMRQSMYAQIRKQRTFNKNFMTRSQDGGVRIWRIA